MSGKRNGAREYRSPLDPVKHKLVAARESLHACRNVDGRWLYTFDEEALFALLDKCFEEYEEYCRMLHEKSEMYRRQLGGMTAAARRKKG